MNLVNVIGQFGLHLSATYAPMALVQMFSIAQATGPNYEHEQSTSIIISLIAHIA
jgi:hypothetical protein